MPLSSDSESGTICPRLCATKVCLAALAAVDSAWASASSTFDESHVMTANGSTT